MQHYAVFSCLIISFFTISSDYKNPRTPQIAYLPWRNAYQQKVDASKSPLATTEKKPCIFCTSKNADPQNDTDNLVLQRNLHTFIALPTQPYVLEGHIMIIPNAHVENLETLPDEVHTEIHDCAQKLTSMFFHKGFPIVYTGFNIGPTSGASIAHLHYHIFPEKIFIHNLVQAVDQPELPPITKRYKRTNKYIDSFLQNSCKNSQQQKNVHEKNINPCLLCDLPTICKDLIFKENKNSYVALYPWPETDGHVAIIPKQHVASISDLDKESFDEIINEVQPIASLLKKVLHIPGLNIGSYNSQDNNNHICMEILATKQPENGCLRTIAQKKVLFANVPQLVKTLRNEITQQRYTAIYGDVL
ncbi:MAG TPA: HIT domain-containing protein [Candidatus Bathyarchaeia archaeon]|nr:HIT domain-containing protein [Candidatus Bathyarchaeia archaeon]